MSFPAVSSMLFKRLLRDCQGAIGIMFAFMLVPFLIAGGTAIDFTRMIQYKTDLQGVVDAAALAGATAYTNAAQATNAQQIATSYFNHAALPPSLTLSSPAVVTNANGTINPSLGTQGAYTVTVSASATLPPSLLYMLSRSMTISATATAANPQVMPSLNASVIRSSACDSNAVYLYSVPVDTNGQPKYTTYPAFTTGAGGNYYMIGNNTGAAKPSNQALPTIAANQHLGFLVVNTTNGNNAGCGANISGANSYGAPNGGSQSYYSANLAANLPPSQSTNYSYTLATPLLGLGSYYWEPTGSSGTSGFMAESDPGNANCGSSTGTVFYNLFIYTLATCTTQMPTTSAAYATSSSNATGIGTTPNCSLYVQTGVTTSYISGLSSSSVPPNSVASGQGNCYSATSTGTNYATAGSQYASPTCSQLSQLSAHSAVYWWNDLGGERSSLLDGIGLHYGYTSYSLAVNPGSGDDRDYNDAFFSITCQVTSGGSGTGNTAVVLVN